MGTILSRRSGCCRLAVEGADDFRQRCETAIAGVVAISGRLLRPQLLAAETRVKPPVLLAHGDQDPVVDFREMALAGDALVAAGFQTFGHVMKGTGHGIAPDGLQVALAFLAERLPK